MKILAIQNRMGIGDTVIFLPYIKKISDEFNVPINLLVKENSKADQFLNHTSYIDQIIILDRGNHKTGKHDGIIGSFRLASDLKKYKFDKVFIFNSSLRFNLISRLAGIKDIYQYPLFTKKNQHVINPAITLIKKNLDIVDLTGAGDLFASGYLHGYLNNFSQRDCLEQGTKMSSKIIQQIGARL